MLTIHLKCGHERKQKRWQYIHNVIISVKTNAENRVPLQLQSYTKMMTIQSQYSPKRTHKWGQNSYYEIISVNTIADNADTMWS